MIRKYLIANLIFEIDFDTDKSLEDRLSKYISDINRKADIKINISKTSEDISVRQENLVKLSDIAYFYEDKLCDTYFYYDPNVLKTVGKIVFSKDYSDIDITLCNLNESMGIEDDMLMFNVVGTAVSYCVQMHGGFVFHSSSVCYNGGGVAFSAKSGTGKSTHTSLWLNNFEGTYILNDDTPIISLGKDGAFYISGTPWAGTTGINKNATVPLKAIVFLERGLKNEITPLSPIEAMNPFFEGIRTPLTDKMFSSVLDTINKLFLQVPVYMLKCNMDPEAAMLSCNTIFK